MKGGRKFKPTNSNSVAYLVYKIHLINHLPAYRQKDSFLRLLINRQLLRGFETSHRSSTNAL